MRMRLLILLSPTTGIGFDAKNGRAKLRIVAKLAAKLSTAHFDALNTRSIEHPQR